MASAFCNMKICCMQNACVYLLHASGNAHNNESQLTTQHLLCKKLYGNVACSTWPLVKKNSNILPQKRCGINKGKYRVWQVECLDYPLPPISMAIKSLQVCGFIF